MLCDKDMVENNRFFLDAIQWPQNNLANMVVYSRSRKSLVDLFTTGYLLIIGASLACVCLKGRMGLM